MHVRVAWWLLAGTPVAFAQELPAPSPPAGATQALPPAPVPPGPPEVVPAPTAFPVVYDILYEGNEITLPVTMNRELVVHVGDRADPDKVEHSRQAIQDLGLFREVKVRQEPFGPDGVRLIFKVREKWYVLPIPRLEINSEGDTALGMQLRWNNLWGLNHRLDLYAIRHDYKRDDRDNSNNYSIGYDIPFLGETRNALNINLSHSLQNSNTPDDVSFRERKDRVAVVMSRALSHEGPKSRGWKAGGGLQWQEQHASGEDAPSSWGYAVGPVASVSYKNLRDHLYSETGTLFENSISFAANHALADYGYFQHESHYSYEWAVGGVEHQTMRTSFMLGGYYGGPSSKEHDTFEFGGSEFLRGYDREVIDGNFAYYGSLDYLRPIHWKWLRFLATFEAGSALDSLSHARGKGLYTSIGLGVSVKVTWLVNVQFEAGLAYPLNDGDGLRFFGQSI